MGGLAQLGEHLLCKQGVVGSIPSSSTNVREAGRKRRRHHRNPQASGRARPLPLAFELRYRLFFNNAEEVKQILLERREGRREPSLRQRERDGLDCYRPAAPRVRSGG